MGIKSRQHRERVSSGMDPPFRQPEVRVLVFKCGKCHQSMTEGRVNEHLKECQPGGATCGWCGKLFPPGVFLEHIKGCDGPKKAVLAEPPPGPLGGVKALVDSAGHVEVLKEPDADKAF